MKTKYILLLTFLITLISCKEETEVREIEQQKEAQKREVIYQNISKNWTFTIRPVDGSTQSKVNSWIEWRAFLNEINQKPQKTIGEFQKKADALTKKVDELNLKIPEQFNKPQVRGRIAVISTKIKMMDLFIHLNKIPDAKVVDFIKDINVEILALQQQLEEIVRRTQIPKEVGEPEIIRIQDTTRAIPDSPF